MLLELPIGPHYKHIRLVYNQNKTSNIMAASSSKDAGWQQSLQDLEADERLARQLASEEEIQFVRATASRKARPDPPPNYPHVYDCMLEAKLTLTSLNNQKLYLPESSTRKSYNDYEEITVKKMEKTDIVPPDKLVSIADNFDAVGQVAFAGCSHLNPMQSVVFETAYKTNKNILVAAPTGAGKTNVAMMTVLNELRKWFKPGTTEMTDRNCSEKFKIIYIAPMKSLATEQTDNFNSRLKKLGIKTRELTGDMSMTKAEIARTHIIVTTPEKWDVVTRKKKGDADLIDLVRLLIIDEVHLLQSDRGPVLEALVARTQRHVEASQRMTRIIGLSATLPNYVDIANFLCVNPYDGLFYFDTRFRPVPLTQTFIGVRPQNSGQQAKCMDKICYDLVLQYAMQSKQAMIFVHARNSTQKVANKLREMIIYNQKIEIFEPDLIAHPEAAKLMKNPRNRLLTDLFAIGFGIHHAGMIRQDRLLVERLFREGILKVLVCTATLAWGVNFPAHAVIIRGTEIYDASAGKFVDVGLLDVMQIFGRAGRPQYDTDGHALILTGIDKMDSYLKLLTNQTAIESNFVKHLADNLNAEVVSGTVSDVQGGIEWLRYTYLNVRLAQNPMNYGYDYLDIDLDISLSSIRKRLIVNAARQLSEAMMCRFNEQTGHLEATDLGTIASHFYINHATIMRYNEILHENMEQKDVLELIGEAQEFQQIKYRDEESMELENLRRKCHLPLQGALIETTKGKVSCLLQAYISRALIESHSLISDMLYITQSATRIARGLFKYSLKRGWPTTALSLLKVCKMIELRTWDFHSPFRHFDLPHQVVQILEESRVPIEELENKSNTELGKLVRFPDRMGAMVKECIRQLPYILLDDEMRTIKSNLLRLDLSVKPYFKWCDRYHGRARQAFWLWVVDDEITHQIYHYRHVKFTKEQVQKAEAHVFSLYIPLVDNTLEDGTVGQRIPNEYIVYILSDEWNACDYEFAVDCRKLTLPSDKIVYTRVPKNLNRLPVSVIQGERAQSIFRFSAPSYSNNRSRGHTIAPAPVKVDAFNLIQSQVFYPLYHCDKSILLCGPAGAGKTLATDLAVLRVLEGRRKKKQKLVYVTPSKFLAQHKYRDWNARFGHHFLTQVMILNDNTVFDDELFDQADMIVSTSENFYLWLSNPSIEQHLQRVTLMIFDDLHLMTEETGSYLELSITQLNHMRSNCSKIYFRLVAVSNTIANAQDVAAWLGIKKIGAYNFKQQPIPATQTSIKDPRILYGPLPIESNLLKLSKDDIKRFLVSDSILGSTARTTVVVGEGEDAVKESKEIASVLELKRFAMKKMSHSLIVRRLDKNTGYYGMNFGQDINEFLSKFLDNTWSEQK